MQSSIRWLRVSYRTGVVVDAVAALVMAAEAVSGVQSPLTHYMPEPPYQYAMGLGASLMLGWTILLLWADRQPVERKGVLPITCLVIIGLAASDLFAMSHGLLVLPSLVAILALQVALVVLFTFSYVAAGKVAVGSASGHGVRGAPFTQARH